MKFAICNEIFQGWSLPDTFRFAAKTGYDAIEIAPFTIAPSVTEISPAQRKQIRLEADQAGVAISGIHWVLVQTTGLHLTSPDHDVRSRTSAYFVELVDFCADIGGRFIVVGSPKQRQLDVGISREQGCAWALEVFRDAIQNAERRGVVICFEPLAPSETNFINSHLEGIELVRRASSPGFKMILDVKAMCSMGRPIPQIIRDSAADFAYFHANDANLKGPGFGDVDFRPIVAALREVGYEGYVSVEVFKFDEGPEVIATESRRYLRQVFGEDM